MNEIIIMASHSPDISQGAIEGLLLVYHTWIVSSETNDNPRFGHDDDDEDESNSSLAQGSPRNSTAAAVFTLDTCLFACSR